MDSKLRAQALKMAGWGLLHSDFFDLDDVAEVLEIPSGEAGQLMCYLRTLHSVELVSEVHIGRKEEGKVHKRIVIRTRQSARKCLRCGRQSRWCNHFYHQRPLDIKVHNQEHDSDLSMVGSVGCDISACLVIGRPQTLAVKVCEAGRNLMFEHTSYIVE